MHALHARLTADYLKNADSAKAQGVKDWLKLELLVSE